MAAQDPVYYENHCHSGARYITNTDSSLQIWEEYLPDGERPAYTVLPEFKCPGRSRSGAAWYPYWKPNAHEYQYLLDQIYPCQCRFAGQLGPCNECLPSGRAWADQKYCEKYGTVLNRDPCLNHLRYEFGGWGGTIDDNCGGIWTHKWFSGGQSYSFHYCWPGITHAHARWEPIGFYVHDYREKYKATYVGNLPDNTDTLCYFPGTSYCADDHYPITTPCICGDEVVYGRGWGYTGSPAVANGAYTIKELAALGVTQPGQEYCVMGMAATAPSCDSDTTNNDGECLCGDAPCNTASHFCNAAEQCKHLYAQCTDNALIGGSKCLCGEHECDNGQYCYKDRWNVHTCLPNTPTEHQCGNTECHPDAVCTESGCVYHKCAEGQASDKKCACGDRSQNILCESAQQCDLWGTTPRCFQPSDICPTSGTAGQDCVCGTTNCTAGERCAHGFSKCSTTESFTVGDVSMGLCEGDERADADCICGRETCFVGQYCDSEAMTCESTPECFTDAVDICFEYCRDNMGLYKVDYVRGECTCVDDAMTSCSSSEQNREKTTYSFNPAFNKLYANGQWTTPSTASKRICAKFLQWCEAITSETSIEDVTTEDYTCYCTHDSTGHRLTASSTQYCYQYADTTKVVIDDKPCSAFGRSVEIEARELKTLLGQAVETQEDSLIESCYCAVSGATCGQHEYCYSTDNGAFCTRREHMLELHYNPSELVYAFKNGDEVGWEVVKDGAFCTDGTMDNGVCSKNDTHTKYVSHQPNCVDTVSDYFCKCDTNLCMIDTGLQCDMGTCRKYPVCAPNMFMFSTSSSSAPSYRCRCEGTDDTSVCSHEQPFCLSSGECVEKGPCVDNVALNYTCTGDNGVECNPGEYYFEALNLCTTNVTVVNNHLLIQHVPVKLSSGRCDEEGLRYMTLETAVHCLEYDPNLVPKDVSRTSASDLPDGCVLKTDDVTSFFNGFSPAATIYQNDCTELYPCICRIDTPMPVCDDDVTATERCICGRAKEVVLVGGACVNGASIQMCPDITQRLRLPWGCRCGDTFANKNYYCDGQHEKLYSAVLDVSIDVAEQCADESHVRPAGLTTNAADNLNALAFKLGLAADFVPSYLQNGNVLEDEAGLVCQGGTCSIGNTSKCGRFGKTCNNTFEVPNSNGVFLGSADMGPFLFSNVLAPYGLHYYHEAMRIVYRFNTYADGSCRFVAGFDTFKCGVY